MSPEQIAATQAIANILNLIGSWPVGTLVFAAVLGPWMMMLFISRAQDSRVDAMKELFSGAISAYEKRLETVIAEQKIRFDEVVRMYEKNVELVRDYHTLAGDLTGIITLSTQTLERLNVEIKNNQFCPIVRKEGGA